MCYGCWKEFGGVQIDTPEVRKAARYVMSLYDRHLEESAGLLHIQVEDWNIQDRHWDRPWQYADRDPLPCEVRIVDLMRGMTEEERASALALADGYWGGLREEWDVEDPDWQEGPMDDSDIEAMT